MRPFTEYLQDRPRDGVWWFDAVLIAAVLVILALVVVLGAWVVSSFVLSGFGGLAAGVVAIPASLPWRVREEYGGAQVIDASPVGAGDPDKKPIANVWYRGIWPLEEVHQQAAYISHAANAYPKLVEALRKLVDIEGPLPGNAAWGAEVIALLRDLGEAS